MSRGRVIPVSASLCLNPPSFPRPVYTTAHVRGMKYERQAVEELERRYGKQFIPGPWFIYRAVGDQRHRYCQCDGLLVDLVASRLTIIEIKLRHTQLALDQLCNLYYPVVAKVFENPRPWKIATCEMVNWYDCAEKTDMPVRLRKEIDMAQPGEFAVHVWRPGRHKP